VIGFVVPTVTATGRTDSCIFIWHIGFYFTNEEHIFATLGFDSIEYLLEEFFRVNIKCLTIEMDF
jgi:hypothetical protein